MAIKAIPHNLLIHSVEYEAYLGDDGWDDSFAEPITIENVRVEHVSRLSRGSDSGGEQVNSIVFVDRENSSVFPGFKVRSRITYEGVSREVVDVKPFYTFGPEIHHFEIELK